MIIRGEETEKRKDKGSRGDAEADMQPGVKGGICFAASSSLFLLLVYCHGG